MRGNTAKSGGGAWPVPPSPPAAIFVPSLFAGMDWWLRSLWSPVPWPPGPVLSLQQMLHKYLSSGAGRWLNKRNWSVLDWSHCRPPTLLNSMELRLESAGSRGNSARPDLGNRARDALGVNSFFPT